MLPGNVGTPCWIYEGSSGEGGCVLAHHSCQCLQGNLSRGLQWYPSTIWPLWHSCWCLQGWLWIMSFPDQRPAFWKQAWSVCYINSMLSCPNGSHIHRILRAPEELQIVSPCRENISKFTDQWDINSPCLPQALAREDLFREWTLNFSGFEQEKEPVEFPWLSSPQLLSETISYVC